MEKARVDADQLMYLSDQDKARYAQLEEMFSSAGFGLLTQLCEKLAIEAHNRAANATTWEQNRMNVGLRMAYEHIATIETATHNEYIELADSNRQKVLEAQLEDELAHQT